MAEGGLRHPRLVAIHEIGEHEGQQYFSTDLVTGRNLDELTRSGPLAARRNWWRRWPGRLERARRAEKVHRVETETRLRQGDPVKDGRSLGESGWSDGKESGRFFRKRILLPATSGTPC